MANLKGPYLKGSSGSSVLFRVPSGATSTQVPPLSNSLSLSILSLRLSGLERSTQTAKAVVIHPNTGIFDSSFLPKATSGEWIAIGIAGASKNEVWLITKI